MDRKQFLSRYLLQPTADLDPSETPWHGKTQAAVLIPLLDPGYDDGLELLLTQRSAHLRHHPGQISFPGGRHEPEDEHLLATALRESYEEIGLSPELVTVVGAQPTFSTVTGFKVSPWVGLVPANAPLMADQQEVAELIRVPLKFLLEARNWQHHTFERNGVQHSTWFIKYQKNLIWGATAAMLHQFLRQVSPSGMVAA